MTLDCSKAVWREEKSYETRMNTSAHCPVMQLCRASRYQSTPLKHPSSAVTAADRTVTALVHMYNHQEFVDKLILREGHRK